jgi:simple sugar transport system ATP-binding protein
MTAPATASPLLAVRDVRKSFGSVVAIDNATVSVSSGEVAAIIGDNGAGKSTLVKVITGVHAPDEGTVEIDGRPVHLTSPALARRMGIEAVFQDLALVDDLTVWQNLFLGRESVHGPLGFLRKRDMIDRSAALLDELQIRVPSVKSRVRRLSGGQRQGVALGRAVFWDARLTVMDEPTAALGVRERTEVEDLIGRLKAQGRTFLLISHNFDQVMRLSDEVWVMRSGRVVGHRRTAQTSGDELVALITGARSSASPATPGGSSPP